MQKTGNFPIRKVAFAAVTAALYTALSFVSYEFGSAFGPVQCRLSEALCVLPFLFPETTWGLFVGCILTNLLSMYGPIDVVFGSLATLIGGLLTAKCRTRWLAPLPPILANGLIVSAVIAYAESGAGGAFLPAWGLNILSVTLGEVIACGVLGLILLGALEKSGAVKRLTVN